MSSSTHAYMHTPKPHSLNGGDQALESTWGQRRYTGDELQELPALGFAEAREHVHEEQEGWGIAVVSIRGDEAGKQLFFGPRRHLLAVR